MGQMTHTGFWAMRVFFLLMAAVTIVFSFGLMRDNRLLMGLAYLLPAGTFCLITYAYWTRSYGQMTGLFKIDPPNTPPPGWSWSRAALMTTVLTTGGGVIVALVQEQVLLAIVLVVFAYLASWGVWRWLFWKEKAPRDSVGAATTEPTHK